MDFDAEIAKFLGRPAVAKSFRAAAVRNMQASGVGVATMKAAETWAQKARDEIIASLPESLRNSPNHPITSADLLIKPGTVTPDGKYRFELAWKPGAVHRDSLYEDEYPDGIEDIVALFHKGYVSRDYVYGYWDRHRPIMAYDSRNDNTGGGDFVWMRSRISRLADPFLVDAIAAFNAAHKQDGVTLAFVPGAKYY